MKKTFIVTTSEQVARRCTWRVAIDTEQASQLIKDGQYEDEGELVRDLFNNGRRELIDHDDVEVIEMDVESIAPEDAA